MSGWSQNIIPLLKRSIGVSKGETIEPMMSPTVANFCHNFFFLRKVSRNMKSGKGYLRPKKEKEPKKRTRSLNCESFCDIFTQFTHSFYVVRIACCFFVRPFHAMPSHSFHSFNLFSWYFSCAKCHVLFAGCLDACIWSGSKFTKLSHVLFLHKQQQEQ